MRRRIYLTVFPAHRRTFTNPKRRIKLKFRRKTAALTLWLSVWRNGTKPPRAKTDNSGPERVYRVYGKAGSRKLFESFAEFQESLEANAEDASERLVEIESGKE